MQSWVDGRAVVMMPMLRGIECLIKALARPALIRTLDPIVDKPG